MDREFTPQYNDIAVVDVGLFVEKVKAIEHKPKVPVPVYIGHSWVRLHLLHCEYRYSLV